MLRLQELMLLAGMLDQAVADAGFRKAPAPVREALREARRRVKAAQLEAPVPVQAAFQESFCRSDCVALATCVDYARNWLTRDGQQMDGETERGFAHVREKLNRYVDEMDAAGEMQGWLNQPLIVPSVVAPK